MRIIILVEGDTEKAFRPFLLKYLETSLHDKMPRIRFHPYNTGIPTGDKLKRVVRNYLSGKNVADHVIALTDVYTGKNPPLYHDAEDAKRKMRSWVGDEPRFHPHVAQHDFESWLLPYWDTIKKFAKHNANAPSGAPETINHNKPPAYRIKEIFEKGQSKKSYVKPRDAKRILSENDLSVAIEKCPELKAFINTIFEICNAPKIP